MIGARAESTELRRDERGAAFVEWLIVFVPLWTMFLCVLQLAMVAQADLIVRHAADSAARSAAVVLPDDPAEYGGEPKMLIGRERARVIRRAAAVPLMPLSPTRAASAVKPTLRGALSDPRSIAHADRYLASALEVTFPSADDGAVVGAEVTVRVSYRYACVVPLARQLVCSTGKAGASARGTRAAARGRAARWNGDRHRQIVHERTLMVHRAPYTYRSRGRS